MVQDKSFLNIRTGCQDYLVLKIDFFNYSNDFIKVYSSTFNDCEQNFVLFNSKYNFKECFCIFYEV